MSQGAFLASAILSLLTVTAATAQPDSNVTVVSALVDRLGEAPLPKVGQGIANYSPEQLNAARCLQKLDFVDPFPATSPQAFDKAYDATVNAQKVRVAAFLGQANQTQMDQAELARQAAVNKLFPVRGWPHLRVDQYAEQSPSVKIDTVTYKVANENTRKVVEVSFVVHNLTASKTELPPVTLVYGDTNGFVLGARTMPLDSLAIDPHASLPFTLRLDNPPAYLTSITARFQGGTAGFDIESFDMHDCPKFDAGEKAQAARNGETLPVQLGGSPPAPVSKAWTANYSAQDLEGLEDLDQDLEPRAFAQGADAPCESPGHRGWRDLLVAADSLSKAWETTRADEDIREGAVKGVFLPEDVAAADLASKAATDAAFTARRWSPTAAQYPNLTLKPPTLQLSAIDLVTQQGVAAGHVVRGITIRGDIDGPLAGSPPPIRVSALDANGYVIVDAIGVATALPSTGASYAIYLPYVPVGFVSRLVVEFAC